MSYIWNEMTYEQQNELIAEKVMNWQWLECPKEAKQEIMNPRYIRSVLCPPNESWGISYPIPDFVRNKLDAFDVFDNMKKRLFSERRLFMQHLQKIVSKRSELSHGLLISWPDVFWFVESPDICLAALLTLDVDIVY